MWLFAVSERGHGADNVPQEKADYLMLSFPKLLFPVSSPKLTHILASFTKTKSKTKKTNNLLQLALRQAIETA